MRSRIIIYRSAMYLMLVGFIVSTVFASNIVQASPSVGLLKEGVVGDAVVKLQMLLKENGFYDGSIDGQFGSGTLEAVLDFQIDQDLFADGVAGPETLLALREVPPISRGKTTVNRKAREIVTSAKKFLDTPYVWAGAQPGGFDCSGYIYYVFAQNKIDLPRMADEQYNVGVVVKRSQLQEGDLVYFSTYEPGPSHVGIYIGGNKFIHASSGSGQVTVTSMEKPYYVARYIGAKRVVK